MRYLPIFEEITNVFNENDPINSYFLKDRVKRSNESLTKMIPLVYLTDVDNIFNFRAYYFIVNAEILKFCIQQK